MNTNKILAFSARILLILTLSACAQLPGTGTSTTSAAPTAMGADVNVTSATAPLLPEYDSPMPNAEYVSPGTTIAIRYGLDLSQQQVSGLKFNILGSASGLHSGKTVLADDRQTVIFQPRSVFLPKMR